MLATVSVALADNGPHQKDAGDTPDSCAGCHRAHTGQSAKLLKEAGGQAALCLSCHDGTGATTNVVDGIDSSNNCLRGGGFTNARINTSATLLTTDPQRHGISCLTSGQPVNSSHSTDGSAQTIWGYGNINASPDPGQSSYQLRCGSCHDPHGNGNYRILRIPPVDVSPVTATPTMDDESTKDYTINDYWRAAKSYAEKSGGGTTREMTKWCAQCHSRHMASTGSGSTDSGDAIFAYRHTVDGGSYTVTQACDNCHNNGKNVTMSCVKCHVAHGSNATVSGEAASVPWPGGTGSEDSALLRMNERGICQRCHGK